MSLTSKKYSKTFTDREKSVEQRILYGKAIAGNKEKAERSKRATISSTDWNVRKVTE